METFFGPWVWKKALKGSKPKSVSMSGGMYDGRQTKTFERVIKP